MTSHVFDPSAIWREKARACLQAGQDLADLDWALELTGPPNVPLKGISEGYRAVLVGARQPFHAHTWTTRMWTCLKIDLPTTPGNSQEGYAYPVGEKTLRKACEHCGQPVTYKQKTYKGGVAPANPVRTFINRVRRSWKALGFETVREPIDFYALQGAHDTFAAWRILEGDFQITTAVLQDLDNGLKGLLDGLCEEKGKPGLLFSDRIVHRIHTHRIQLAG